MEKGTLTIVSGFSGAGKSTVVKELVAAGGYELSISATTRKPREGEADGRDYYFISVEEFERRIREDDFLEWVRYVDNYYGTPYSFTREKLDAGKNVILEIEAQGAFKVRSRIPEARLVFMLPPSMTELKRRLVGRGTESNEVVEARLRRAVEELELARSYDRLMVNVSVEDSVKLLDMIIKDDFGRRPDYDDLLDRLKEESKGLLE